MTPEQLHRINSDPKLLSLLYDLDLLPEQIFAQRCAAVAEEREACAKIADNHECRVDEICNRSYSPSDYCDEAIADAIRARSTVAPKEQGR